MRVIFMPKRDTALKGARPATPKTTEKQSDTLKTERSKQHGRSKHTAGVTDSAGTIKQSHSSDTQKEPLELRKE